MLITIHNDILNVDKFFNMSIRYTPTKKKVPDGEGWFGPKFKEVEVPGWTLSFKYSVCDRPKNYQPVETYYLTSDKESLLKEEAKLIIKQIRTLTPELVNEAFEEAFFKE